MAKKKPNLNEDDFDDELKDEVVEEVDDAEEVEAVEEADDVEEVAEDVEPVEEGDAVEVAEDADQVEVAEDVEAVEAADDGEAVEEVEIASGDEPAAKPKPKGKNTTLTLVLCGFNVAAALAFIVLLLLDYNKRHEWTYAAFMNELFIQGLPLQSEEIGISASRVSGARQKLSTKQISDVLSQRGGKGSGEAFWVVDEPFSNSITPQALTPVVLKDYFGNLGTPVSTLEEEVKRLKEKVLADIANAARGAAGALKDDDAKRKFASRVLLSLAYDVHQVEALDKKIKAAKGKALDDLIEDACQRRMLVDILAPCEIFRPGAVSAPLQNKVADLDKFKLDELQNLLRKRFDVAIADKFDGDVHLSKDWDAEKRLTTEKRATIGFLLLTIATLQKPEADAKQPDNINYVALYPDGSGAGTPNMLRAQTVLGLYEFAAAAQNLPVAWDVLEKRMAQAIQVDREGYTFVYTDKGGKFKDSANKPARNDAFIDKHATEIQALRDVVLEIRKAENTLAALKVQNATAQKIYEFRAEQLKELTARLQGARTVTKAKVAELNELQKQLFQAQQVLAGAQDRNLSLEKAIQTEENKATGSKRIP